MVPDDSDRIPRVPPYSGGLLDAYPLPVRDFHPLRSGFPAGSGSYMHLRWKLLQPRHVRKHGGLGSVPFDRHYSGYRFFLSLPQGTKMFQFPWFAPSKRMVTGLQPAGLPHSDVRGSFPVCRSPRLFAAYHVLLRLRKPRHPPFALIRFLSCESDCQSRPPGHDRVSILSLVAYETAVFTLQLNTI